MKSITSIFCVVLILAGNSWACSRPNVEREAEEARGFGTEQKWSAARVFRIGEGAVTPSATNDSVPLFGAVADIAVGARGDIFVSDGMARVIYVFDRTGMFVDSIGGPGGGPGEFLYPASIGVTRGDTLRVYDPEQFRVTVYGPHRSLVRSYNVEPQPELGQRKEAAFSLDGTLCHLSYAQFAESLRQALGARRRGIVRGRNLVECWDEVSGNWRATKSLSGLEVFVDLDRSLIADVPFRQQPVWTPLNNGVIVVANSADGSVNIVSPSGDIRRTFFSGFRSVEVDDIERRAFYDATDISDLSDDGRRRTRERRSGIPVPASKPAVTKIVRTGENGFWLAGSKGEEWRAFDSDGRLLGRLMLPSDFELKVVHGDSLYGIEQDSLNVHYVSIYGLRKP